MKTPRSKGLIQYGISFGISLLMSALFVCSRMDLQNPGAAALVDWYRTLCDAFTIPGFLFLSIALMLTLSGEGALDGVTYVLLYAGRMLIPGAARKKLRYWDYVEGKKEKRPKGFGFLYVVGLSNMAAAVAFWALFYTVY